MILDTMRIACGNIGLPLIDTIDTEDGDEATI
jgi:hypothetical protein